MKILIIEDDERMALILKHFLEPVASQIRIATTMEQALNELTQAEELSLITLDLGLPDSDVISTVKKIRDIRKAKPDSLIVVVTGQEVPRLEDLAMEEGADGVVFKQGDSFTPKGFLQILYSITQKYLKHPQDYQRSIAMLEKVSNKIAQLKNNENDPTAISHIS